MAASHYVAVVRPVSLNEVVVVGIVQGSRKEANAARRVSHNAGEWVVVSAEPVAPGQRLSLGKAARMRYKAPTPNAR